MTAGAYQIEVPHFIDARGRLVAFEQARPLPFKPVRTFVISNVPAGARRAGHTVPCHEFLWMAAGSCGVRIRPPAGQAGGEEQFRLAAQGPGLYLPKGLWLELFQFSADGILICRADAEYDADPRAAG